MLKCVNTHQKMRPTETFPVKETVSVNQPLWNEQEYRLSLFTDCFEQVNTDKPDLFSQLITRQLTGSSDHSFSN